MPWFPGHSRTLPDRASSSGARSAIRPSGLRPVTSGCGPTRSGTGRASGVDPPDVSRARPLWFTPAGLPPNRPSSAMAAAMAWNLSPAEFNCRDCLRPDGVATCFQQTWRHVRAPITGRRAAARNAGSGRPPGRGRRHRDRAKGERASAPARSSGRAATGTSPSDQDRSRPLGQPVH